MSTSAYARSFPILTDEFPANVVTQGHVDYCRENGHATHTVDGVDQGKCPRCGSVTTPPPGLTGTDPMPYGHRRWNGAVWADVQVDRYNAELARIASRHAAGMDVDALVNGLYSIAHQFDRAGN